MRAASLRSSTEDTPLLAIIRFIMRLVTPVIPGSIPIQLGIAICPPRAGIFMALLPKDVTLRSRSFSRRPRP